MQALTVLCIDQKIDRGLILSIKTNTHEQESVGYNEADFKVPDQRNFQPTVRAAAFCSACYASVVHTIDTMNLRVCLYLI